jgi:ribosomal protein S18 acetylase RimI-like enzyme
MEPEIEIHIPSVLDGQDVVNVAASTPLFTAEEVGTVREIWQEYIQQDDEEDPYLFLAAYHDGQLVGFSCFGHRSLTQSTYLLYWIAVDNSLRNMGIGRRLLKATEEAVMRIGGTQIVIETSDDPSYEPTRKFYSRLGYTEAGAIPDFYKAGDGLVVYFKHMIRPEIEEKTTP